MFRTLSVLFVVLACRVPEAAAQVNGPGPSDPNDFDTVINLPSDQPSIDGSVGNSDGSPTPTTQLNVTDGGTLGLNSSFGFTAYSGSEINISGGVVGDDFDAWPGSEVNISGGHVGEDFEANPGSVVNISGGSFGEFFSARSNSEVSISGGNFGGRFRASSTSFPGGGRGAELIGGEFRFDGAPYTESRFGQTLMGTFTGTLEDGSSFIFTYLASDSLPGVILTSVPLPSLETTPQFVSSDISSTMPSGLRPGQTMTLLEGGVLGMNFAVVDATLNIEGGEVGEGLEVAGGVINVHDGSVGDLFAYPNGNVIVSNGTVSSFGARGGEVTITGGTVGDRSSASSGGVVNITGGSVGMSFQASQGGVLNITGGNLGDYATAHDGSVVNIAGGSVGEFFEAQAGSVVSISGGSIGEWFRARSEVNISGGDFSNRFDAFDGSVVNISGGNLPDGFNALNGSEVNINGGNVGNDFDALPGSVVNIRGGNIGQDFAGFSRSNVNLFGTAFFLDGVELTDLVIGVAFTILDRDVTLTGVLADGSAYQYDLNSTVIAGEDFLPNDATLTVTLVPEPSSVSMLLIAGVQLLYRRRPRLATSCSHG